MTRHVREPARLVHLAPARLGRADPGARLHGVRRVDAHARAGRAAARRLRDARRRRLVRAADRGVPARRARRADVRRHDVRARARHPRRLVRFGLEPRGRARRAARADLAGRHVPRGHRPVPRLVPVVAAGRPRHARARAVSRSPHPRLRRRRAGPQDVEVGRQRRRAAAGDRRRAAPTSCGCGCRWSTTATRSALGKEMLARNVEAYRKIRNTFRYLLSNLYDFDPARDAVPAAAHARGRSLRAGALRASSSRRVLRRLRRLRLPDRLPRAQRVRDGRPERVLPRRLEGSALHASAPTPTSGARPRPRSTSSPTA